MKMKAVLFDLDGTLLNREQSLLSFIRDQYRRFQEQVGQIPLEQYVQRFVELDQNGHVWKDRVYQQLVGESSIALSMWRLLYEDYVNHFHQSSVPFPNLIKTLDALKGEKLQLGLITNGWGEFQMRTIRALGIEDYFDCILISEWEGIKKPDPLIFHRALERLGRTADECLILGDHPLQDIQAARSVGIRGVWKRNSLWPEPLEADFQIDDLWEIVQLVVQWKR